MTTLPRIPLARLELLTSNQIFREQDRKRLAWLFDNFTRAEYLRSVAHDLQDFRERIDQEIIGQAPVLDSDPE